MKIICILFHVGKNKKKLSKDTELRLLAGAELARENSELIILFIGGGGLEIPGAELMKSFWIENFSTIKNEFFILNSSNNTFDNMKEAKSFLSRKNILFSEISVVSNRYHLKRLQGIISKLNLKATVLSAEEILISKGMNVREVKKYLNSMEYRRKVFLELVLEIYLLLDLKQRLIRAWRWHSYRD